MSLRNGAVLLRARPGWASQRATIIADHGEILVGSQWFSPVLGYNLKKCCCVCLVKEDISFVLSPLW